MTSKVPNLLPLCSQPGSAHRPRGNHSTCREPAVQPSPGPTAAPPSGRQGRPPLSSLLPLPSATPPPSPLFSASPTNCPQRRFPSTVFVSTCLLFQFRLNHCFSAASPSPPWKKCFASQDKNSLCASSSGRCGSWLSSSLPPHPSPPCSMFPEGPQ